MLCLHFMVVTSIGNAQSALLISEAHVDQPEQITCHLNYRNESHRITTPVINVFYARLSPVLRSIGTKFIRFLYEGLSMGCRKNKIVMLCLNVPETCIFVKATRKAFLMKGSEILRGSWLRTEG
ncbi:hypothetical protein BDZ91DRAFT_768146 [Kalaharituber pfeilii]|nr:hypothetical protein BDZ91DRAFT_768146 [Kalaharituber pfeilii]